MNHIETYLTHLRDTRATGEAVKETSYYPALSTLLNAVGAELKPKVKCVINIRNRGAGIPDGGLFTAEQLRASVLREELKLERGLAGERVYVLDPCCGTGAYLVEVLKRIKRTVDEEGADSLSANDLKEAAMRRVFGFEVLPASFVVAHLRLGLVSSQATTWNPG